MMLASHLVGAISSGIVVVAHHQMQMSRRNHQGTVKYLQLENTLAHTTT